MIRKKISFFKKNKTLIIFLLSFLIFASLPKIFFLRYWHPLDAYRTMWLNLLGGHYSLQVEVPKPFMVFLASFVAPQFTYFIASLFCALLVVCFAKLSEEISGSIIYGLAASFFYFFCTLDILLEFLVSSGSPVYYIPLLFFSTVLFIKHKYKLVSLTLFICGLIRPETWLYSLAFPLVLKMRREKIKLIYFLPLLAPFTWSIFDYFLAKDFLFSYHINQKYTAISGILATTFYAFWPQVIEDVLRSYPMILIVTGLSAITIRVTNCIKEKRVENNDLPIMMGPLLLLAYWIFSFKKDFVLYPRFFNFFGAVLIFYSAIFVSLLPINKKIIKIIILSIIVIFAFNVDILGFSIRTRKIKEIHMTTNRELRDFLCKYMDKNEIKGCIAAEITDSWTFSINLGEDFSKKIMQFREIVTNPSLLEKCVGGLAVYQSADSPVEEQLKFLLKPTAYVVYDKYLFRPIFVSSNKEGVIYTISKK